MVNEYSFKYMSCGLFWTSLTIFPELEHEGIYSGKRHSNVSPHVGKLLPVASKSYLVLNGKQRLHLFSTVSLTSIRCCCVVFFRKIPP